MKRFFLLLIFSLSFSLLFAHDWKLCVEPLFGLKYGQIDEFVFAKKSYYSDDKLSELNWEIKPELFAGIKTDFGYKGAFMEIGFLYGIPMGTGNMLDSDWYNLQIKNAGEYQYKTHYSESDNYLKHDFSLSVSTGYKFDAVNGEFCRIRIKPDVSFEYNNFSFNGKNGYAWYGKKTPSYYESSESAQTPTYDFSGKDVIDYSRQSYIIWTGFDLELEFLKKITVNAGFQISPYIYAESIDIHYLTKDGTVYLDATSGFFKVYNWSAGLAYEVNSRNSLSLLADFFLEDLLRGDDYTKSYESYKKNNNFNPETTINKPVEGGASANYFSISISWKFRFF